MNNSQRDRYKLLYNHSHYCVIIFSVIAFILEILCFVYSEHKSDLIDNKRRYELFDGYVYKVDLKIVNVKCINGYKNYCYKYQTNYDYTIYANNTDTFCMANVQSETNITTTIMTDYYIGKNVIWSKKKNQIDHICSVENVRKYYQNKINMIDKRILITLYLFIAITLLLIVIIQSINYLKKYVEEPFESDVTNNTIENTSTENTYCPVSNNTTEVSTTGDIEMNVTECICCCKNTTQKIAFIPCGHTYMCETCYIKSKIHICPMCRGIIKSTFKIYVD